MLSIAQKDIGSPMRKSYIENARTIIIANLPFVIYFIFELYLSKHVFSHPFFIQSLIVNIIVFVAPGYAWVNSTISKEDPVFYLFKVMFASTGLSLIGLLVLAVFREKASGIEYALCLTMFANLGLLWRYRYNTLRVTFPNINGKLFALLAFLLASLFYCQSYIGAAYKVPPLEDHDTETQGTAYGLIHTMKPYYVTNRGTVHFFAHTLLLHLYIGQSAFLSGDLERLEHYYESALSIKEKKRRHSYAELYKVWKEGYERFKEDPVLVPTRTPNLFLASAALFILAFIIWRKTGSMAAAAGTSILFMTLPEVYVRSSYGGYFAITMFFMLMMTYSYLEAIDSSSQGNLTKSTLLITSLIVGFLGVWANHKLVFVPVAFGVHAIWRLYRNTGRNIINIINLKEWNNSSTLVINLKEWNNSSTLVAIMLLIGVFAGWASFAIYGFWVAPRDFVVDHIWKHVLGRFQLQDVRLVEKVVGDWVYPSIAELWVQYGEHIGWVVAVLAIVAICRALPRLNDFEGGLLFWFGLGAVAFSITDWRQTKHLSLIIPPLVLLIGLLWGR